MIENDDALEFYVRQPSAIGLYGLEQPSPGLFHLGPESLEDYQELGFPGLDRPPAAELALLAYSSGRDNPLFLGHLAQFLAERFDALIDFGGLLGYEFSFHDISLEEEKGRLAEVRALVSSLPGRVWEMPYAAYGGGYGYSHVGAVSGTACPSSVSRSDTKGAVSTEETAPLSGSGNRDGGGGGVVAA